MASLISEFKRRGGLRVVVAYALASWILIEAGSVLLPTFGAPEWMFRSYVIFILLGLIVALVGVWFFKITPAGLQLEVQSDDTAPAAMPAENSRKLNFILIGMLVVALGVSLSLNLSGFRSLPVSDDAADTTRSIAVLPFSNISDDPTNVVFVDGIHDDLLTKLANIESMQVTSRTSVMAYRDSTKNLRQIGDELGVRNVLEGSIQRVGDNVRINMQLIKADSDEHLWAKTYDRQLTAKNIFDIQSEISSQIAHALKATLSTGEMDRLAMVPTENIDAYRLATAGRQNLHQRLYETIVDARDQFQQAINLDPQYCDAHVGLADSIMLLSINHNAIPAQQAYSEAQTAIDQALQLNPDHAGAFATQGLILSQRAMLDSDHELLAQAEQNFQQALKLNPSNASAWMWYSSIKQRQNDLPKALEYNQKSIVLDPLGRIPYLNLANLQSALNHNELATQDYLKAIGFHPEWPTTYNALSSHLQNLGRMDEAMAWARLGNELDRDPFKNSTSIAIEIELGLLNDAKLAIEQIDPSHPAKKMLEAYILLMNGDELAAMESIEANYAGREDALPYITKAMANIAMLTGDLERISAYALRLHPPLAQEDVIIDQYHADDALKMAYVWSQRGEQQRAGKLLEKILSAVSEQTRLGIAGHGIRDVQALAMLGRHDEAIIAFEQAVAEGYVGALFFDGWLLEQDPFLQSIREAPAFLNQVEVINAKKSLMRNSVEKAKSENDWQSLRQITRAY